MNVSHPSAAIPAPCTKDSFRRGKSVLGFPRDFVALDLETTGLRASADAIIEVGCIRFRDGRPAEKFETFINPERRIGRFITRLTGITDAMVGDAPRFADTADAIWDFIGDDLIVGHNVGFDVGFLFSKFNSLDGRVFANDYVDTLRIFRRCCPALPHHRLTDLTDFFGIRTVHHRALADAEAAATGLRLLEAYSAEHGIRFGR
ncbi:MAG: 3'-5' exonuclease [Sutterellaceae bacterium]|nr:3'-5' exonuclease [Sutterellaceae bacterium]MDD7441651.1 3'-5' exonuclease [Sutterellaceae bacterium]MDY2867965.1 3'-5' exonuclease [Mesosutterella sp.]